MNIPRIHTQTLNPAYVLLVFLLLDFPYQYGFRYLSLVDSISYTLIDALLYTGILIMTMRLDLVRLTLCFLALPYFIFIIGWLNILTATVLMVIFIVCLFRTLQTNNLHETTLLKQNVAETKNIRVNDLLVFILVLVWINLSGIGGYGFQWSDYAINNARLHDLVVKEWPIRYGDNQNFVYYFGYFLPSAIIGKLFSINVATRSVYLWAVSGVVLALRWLSRLSQWRFSFCLALIFVLFGPLDILNVFYAQRHDSTPLVALAEIFHNDDMDTLNFTTSYQMRYFLPDFGTVFFLGNYLSNSFQLYWSPQQLIAGWLCAGLMMHLFIQNKNRHVIFIYALLCLWGPLVMIALLPFVLVIVVSALQDKAARKELISPENIIGAGSLASVFVIFYLGGSNTANASIWLANAVNWQKKGDLVFVFYLAGWGIYAIALTPYILNSSARIKTWFVALVCALAMLPLRIFGDWSDLLCRGSGPLMFLLLVFFLRAIHFYWRQQKKIRAALLLCLLIPGTASALLINSASNANYGQTQPVKSLLSYNSIYPNFGPDDSLFNRLFRAPLPTRKTNVKMNENPNAKQNENTE